MFTFQNLGGLKQHYLLTATVALLLSFSVTAVEAQQRERNRKGPATILGNIVKVGKRGRMRVLTVQGDDGKEKEYIVSSRTVLTIKGDGDSGLFKPGTVVKTQVVQLQQKLYGKTFTVYLDGAAGLRSVKSGKGGDVFDLIGPILQATDKELILDLGLSHPSTVILEEGYKVRIISHNPALIEAGDSVKLEGFPVRGHFKTKLVTITLKNPLDAAKYYELLKHPKRRGRRKVADRSRSSRKKRGDKGHTKPPAKPNTNNPFAELDKKKKSNKE